MSNTPHRLEIAEYVSLAGSVVGSIVAVISGQASYAALPLSASVLLNAINRQRLERLMRQNTNAAIARVYRQLSEEMETLYASLPAARSEMGHSGTVQQLRAAFGVEIQDRLALLDRNKIEPVYRDLTELQNQYASLQNSLASVVQYLNSLSLSPQVEPFEQRLEQLEQGMARVSQDVEASVQTQMEAPKGQLLDIPHQDGMGDWRLEQKVEYLEQGLNQLWEGITRVSQQVEAAVQTQMEAPKGQLLAMSVPEAIADPPVEDQQEIESVAGTVPLTPPHWYCDRTFKGHSDWVSAVTIGRDGQTLISASFDQCVKIWNLQTGELLDTLSENGGGIYSLALSLDGKTLASGTSERRIKIWDLESGRLIDTFWEASASVRSVAMSPNGEILASGNFDHTIKLWDLNTRNALDVLTGHLGAVGALAFNFDGKILASGGADGLLKIWDCQRRELLHSLSGDLGSIRAIAFSPDGQLLASVSSDRTIKLWHPGTGQRLNTLKGHRGAVTSVVFSPDGETLISGSADATIGIWHLSTGQLLNALREEGGDSVLSVDISPDGQAIASGSADGMIKIWRRT